MLKVTPSSSRGATPNTQYYINKFEFSDIVLNWGLDGVRTAGAETSCLPLLAKYEPGDRA